MQSEEVEESKEAEEYGYIQHLNLDMKNLIISKDLKFKDKSLVPDEESINRNYDFLFSEDETLRIEILTQRMFSSKLIRYSIMRLRLAFLEKAKKLYVQEMGIWEDIHYLTSEYTIDDEKERKIVLESMREIFTIIKSIEERNNIICIKTKFGEIKFSRIKDFFPDIQIDDEEVNNIEERMGTCHYRSVEYSEKLRDMGINNHVVTANRYSYTNKSKYLHSWIEFEVDGKEHCMDYTQNVVMNKEGYYFINHISKVLGRVCCEDIINDKKYINQLKSGNKEMDLKTYLICRDEIIRDLQRNENIFDGER